MNCTTTPLIKNLHLSIIPTCNIPSITSNLKPSSSQFLSLPYCYTNYKPITLTTHSWLTQKPSSRPNLVPLVQTSDWAQKEEETGEGGGEGEGGEFTSSASVDTIQLETEASGGEYYEGGELVSEDGGGEGVEEEQEQEEEEEEETTYPEPPEEAKLFVGNLPYDYDSQKLAELFNQAGVVEIAEVIYNRQTDQSRGFGFVTMSTVEEAEKAVELFNRYDANGRLLTVNKAAPKGSPPERTPRAFEPSFRIYVGNLPWQVDNGRLEQVFSEHGKVIDARVVYDRETGRSRGFGFVTMASETEVNDAIAALDGQSLDGRSIRVNVAEERPRRSFF